LDIQLRGTNAIEWRTDDFRSRLGGALVAVAVTAPALTREAREAKLNEAETLLLTANEALQTGSGRGEYKQAALLRLVRLYEAWDKQDKTAAWQHKLSEFEKAQASIQTATPAEP